MQICRRYRLRGIWPKRSFKSASRSWSSSSPPNAKQSSRRRGDRQAINVRRRSGSVGSLMIGRNRYPRLANSGRI